MQSGFQNLSFTTGNNILSEQGDKKLGWAAVFNTIAQGLVHKNLREPSNWNLLFDLLCVLCIMILCIRGAAKEFPLSTCVIVMLVFIAACFGWVVYYVHSRKK